MSTATLAPPAGRDQAIHGNATAVGDAIASRRKTDRDAMLAIYLECVKKSATDPNYKPGAKELEKLAEVLENLDITAPEFQSDITAYTRWLEDSARFADIDGQTAKLDAEYVEAGNELKRLREAIPLAEHNWRNLEGRLLALSQSHGDFLRRELRLTRLFGEYEGPTNRGAIVGFETGGLGSCPIYEDGTYGPPQNG